jgi:hypothetical protein
MGSVVSPEEALSCGVIVMLVSEDEGNGARITSKKWNC